MSHNEINPWIVANPEFYRFDWNVPELNLPHLGSPKPCQNGWNCKYRSKDGRPCNRVHPGEEGCSRKLFEADAEHKNDCVRMCGCPFHNHPAHFYDRMIKNMTFDEYKKYKKWSEFRAPRNGFCTYYADEAKKALEVKEEKVVVPKISDKDFTEQFCSSLTAELISLFEAEEVKAAIANMGFENISIESIVSTLYKSSCSWQLVKMAQDIDYFTERINSTCEYLKLMSINVF